jgi:hypothetical protein
MNDVAIIEQLKIMNRLKAIELSFKVIEIMNMPKAESLHLNPEIQKFIGDIATNDDIPIENYNECIFDKNK